MTEIMQNNSEKNGPDNRHGVVNSGPVRILTIIGQIEGHTQLPADAKTTKSMIKRRSSGWRKHKGTQRNSCKIN